ncbi:hypothetical protein LINPERHAP1_LOCUS25722, partial [Linum perenne]
FFFFSLFVSSLSLVVDAPFGVQEASHGVEQLPLWSTVDSLQQLDVSFHFLQKI